MISEQTTGAPWAAATDNCSGGAGCPVLLWSLDDKAGGSGTRIDFPEGITQPRNDPRSQVVTGSYGLSGTNETFRYDLDANRVFHRRAGVDRDLVVDAADQLRDVRRQTDGALLEQFLHDAAGRRTVKADFVASVFTGYVYDGLGRLTAVADTAGYELTLAYDPLGNRIRRTEKLPGAASETTLFLAGLVELRDVDAAGQAAEVVRWIPGPGPGGVVAEVSAGPSAQAPVLWSLLGDAAGNVVRMARVDVVAGGALATTRATVRYAAFGQQIAATGSAPTERRFAGMLHEGASGLVHMGARHYDPRLGAFLQPDPLGIAAVATYAYAANNPYRFVDPSGLDPVSIAGDFGFSLPTGGSGFSPNAEPGTSSFPQSETGRASRDLQRALEPGVAIEQVGIAITAFAAGLEVTKVGVLAFGALAGAEGATIGTAALAAPLVTVTIGGGLFLTGTGAENIIRTLNLQTGLRITTPNEFLGGEIFPVFPALRDGGPLDLRPREED